MPIPCGSTQISGQAENDSLRCSAPVAVSRHYVSLGTPIVYRFPRCKGPKARTERHALDITKSGLSVHGGYRCADGLVQTRADTEPACDLLAICDYHRVAVARDQLDVTYNFRVCLEYSGVRSSLLQRVSCLGCAFLRRITAFTTRFEFTLGRLTPDNLDPQSRRFGLIGVLAPFSIFHRLVKGEIGKRFNPRARAGRDLAHDADPRQIRRLQLALETSVTRKTSE